MATKRKGKLKHPGMTPAQLDAIGLMTPAELAACRIPFEDIQRVDAAADITRQLQESRKRLAAASEARRGSLAPPANRGGKSSDGSEYVQLVLEDGKIKEVPKRRGYGGEAAIIDWLNATIGAETFADDEPAIDAESLGWLTMPDLPKEIVCVSRRLAKILGYGIVSALPYGQNFYEKSYVLGDNWGTVSIGGQRDTILISLSGTGLAAASDGWELRMRQFLESSARGRITRCDLAHDDYEGATYSVDQADQEHTDGLFNCGGRNPSCEYRGDWKNPNGKGRSFYVGNRKNGKYCRVYEKGRELGAPGSEWVRIEVEFKSVDRVIPFDVLTRPGEYLAASYPAFGWIAERQERIQTTQRVVESGVEKAVEVVKHQFGNYIRALVDLFGVDGFLSRCTRDDKEPAFLKVPHFSFAGAGVHEKANIPAILCAV